MRQEYRRRRELKGGQKMPCSPHVCLPARRKKIVAFTMDAETGQLTPKADTDPREPSVMGDQPGPACPVCRAPRPAGDLELPDRQRHRRAHATGESLTGTRAHVP